MRGYNLVLNSEMVESEDVFSRPTLESVQVLDLEVILVPF